MVDKPVGILHCPERQVTAFSGTAGVRHRAVLAIGGRFMVHVILLLTSVVTLGPFLWMLLSSFKDTPEIVRQPPVLLPT
ncbi:MAG: hypothetical protein HYY04_17175, partial [Chloroflexi bacterium]|nr:hypothetical protein [Chloroflexota bacterium]